MSRAIEVSEVVEALWDLGGEAQAKDIKERVEANRGKIPPQYRTSRTFREADQPLLP